MLESGADGTLRRLQVPWVDDLDVLNAERPDQLFVVDCGSRVTLQGVPGAGMLLVSRHTRRAVVQQDHGCRDPIVDRAHQRRQTAVQERGIADHRHHPVFACPSEPRGIADTGPHAECGMDRLVWREAAEGVASDVSRD